MGDRPMKFRVVQAYSVYRRGAVVDMHEAHARSLVARGFLAPVIEVATEAKAEERATVQHTHQRRQKR